MRVGLLLCDHVNPALRHHSGDYPEMFGAMFALHAPQAKLVIYDVTQGEYPKDVDECDAYMTSGSVASVYDDVPWIHAFESYVRLLDEKKKKLVGICFGHQMMAQALGGHVGKSDRGWGIGIKTARVVQEKSWMRPPANAFRLLLSHADQILELPPRAEIIAANDHCPVAMLQVEEHFLAIQAHPEFTPTYAQGLMDRRREKIGESCVTQAEATLSVGLETGLIMGWFLNFIQGSKGDI